jgi:septum formation protein
LGKDQPLKTNPYPLILASTSKYRSALLAQLGWSFEAISPDVDEDQVKQDESNPSELAQILAKMKAEAVFLKRPESCVIGSDQVCVLGNEILGKPLTKQRAIDQLVKMQGRSHELITAVCLISPEKQIQFINKTILHMRHLTTEEIINYIESDLPLDCAGSYKLESQGIKLFEKIEMDDHTSIIGLPLIQLSKHLLELGYPL